MLRGAVAAAALGVRGSGASAADDNALRAHVRAAQIPAYFTFKPLPEFTFADVRTGKSLSIPRDFAGRVLLLNMWATWCPPCIKEMGSLEELHLAFKGEGVVVLGVNILDRSSPRKIAEWLDARRLTFPVVRGDYEKLDMMPRRFIPQTFVVDRSSRLIASYQGEFNWAHDGIRSLVQYMVKS